MNIRDATFIIQGLLLFKLNSRMITNIQTVTSLTRDDNLQHVAIKQNKAKEVASGGHTKRATIDTDETRYA